MEKVSVLTMQYSGLEIQHSVGNSCERMDEFDAVLKRFLYLANTLSHLLACCGGKVVVVCYASNYFRIEYIRSKKLDCLKLGKIQSTS